METLAEIRKALEANPDHAYITSRGDELYVLRGEMVIGWCGRNFDQMNMDEINLFIQSQFK